MLTLALLTILFPFVAILGPYVVMLIYSWPLVGIGLTMYMVIARDALIYTAEVENVMEAGSTTGLNIYPLDFLIVALFALGMLKVFFTKKLLLEQKLLLAFGAVLLISFVRGLFEYGLKPAGLELRPFFNWYAVALFVQSYMLNRTSVETVLKLWMLFSWSLVTFVVIRWGMVLTGLSGGSVWTGAGGFGLRVIHAVTALVLVQAIVVMYYPIYNIKRLYYILGMIGLIVVVFVLQHRTLWIVAIVSTMAIFVIDRVKFQQNSIRIWSTLILVVTVAILYIAYNPENIVMHFVESSVSETTQEDSSFAWRVMGWAYLLSPEFMNGKFDYVIGKPIGSGLERTIGDSSATINLAAHNHYVEIFVRTGLIGLSLFLFLIFRLISKLKLISSNGTGIAHLANMLIVLLIGQLVFYFSYSPGYEQGIWLGLATTVASWGVEPDVGQQQSITQSFLS